MSLEQKLDNLVSVIEKLVTVIEAKGVAQPATKQEPAPVAEQPKAVEPPAPVVVPVAAPVVAPAPVAAVMPPLPTFAPVAPPPVAAVPACPFNDQKGMITYVTEVYRALGSRGADMQAEILAMGHHNINEVTPAEYPELYRRLEGLKNGAR